MTGDRNALCRLPSELAHHKALRHVLLTEFPDIDEETLTDTLDGESSLHEILAAVVRSVLDDEAMATGLERRLEDMKARLDRLEARAKRKRALVLRVLTEAEIVKLVESDFTVSVRMGSPNLVVVAEDLIPARYWKPQPPKLDRKAVAADLKTGVTIDGAKLALAERHLSIRTR